MHFTRSNNVNMCYFLIPKSRDLVSHNPGISGLKNGPGSRDPGIRDPGIAIPNRSNSAACGQIAFKFQRMVGPTLWLHEICGIVETH